MNDDYDSVLKKLRGCKTALEMVIGRMPVVSDQDNNMDSEPQSISKDRRESVEYQMVLSYIIS